VAPEALDVDLGEDGLAVEAVEHLRLALHVALQAGLVAALADERRRFRGARPVQVLGQRRSRGALGAQFGPLRYRP